jgi:hypothetical protein
MDYVWQLFEFGMILDEEIDLDQLGWKDGDYFRLDRTIDGSRPMLKKVKVIKKYTPRENDNGA